MNIDITNALIGLIGTVGVNTMAELIASWRIAKRLERIERLLEALPPLVQDVEKVKADLFEARQRVATLESSVRV